MKNGSVEVKLADGSLFGERGKIELLNNEANAKTDTIQIYASFPNEERKLVMGNTLTVTLFRANGKMLPAITPSALMHDSNGSYVYVLDAANKVEKRYVNPGNATAEQQMILSGLAGGETVINKGTHKVLPGMTIAPEAQQRG